MHDLDYPGKVDIQCKQFIQYGLEPKVGSEKWYEFFVSWIGGAEISSENCYFWPFFTIEMAIGNIPIV